MIFHLLRSFKEIFLHLPSGYGKPVLISMMADVLFSELALAFSSSSACTSLPLLIDAALSISSCVSICCGKHLIGSGYSDSTC